MFVMMMCYLYGDVRCWLWCVDVGVCGGGYVLEEIRHAKNEGVFNFWS